MEDSVSSQLLTTATVRSNGHPPPDPQPQDTCSTTIPNKFQGKKVKKKSCHGGINLWCRKYFWEGQHVTQSHQAKMEAIAEDAPWYTRVLLRHRRLIAFILPALVFHFCWWSTMISKNLFYYYNEKYYMALVMIAGSIIAGMTSEGGGAVAFPVMTLAFKIAPTVARDFAIMIQACGMSAASFSILFMHVRIEWRALIVCSLGGATGLLLGLHQVDPILSPPLKKMIFVSIFFAFASVLGYINRDHKRKTYDKIHNINWWHTLVLFITGFLGGLFTSFTGNGLDIFSFSILTLLFRISEKVATPTSVVLMAINSVLCFFWRGLVLSDISQDAWEFLAVCVPVVVIGAPVGSVLGSHFHRIVLASIVIILDVVALVGAYVVIRPLTPVLIGISVAIIVVGFVLFGLISLAGQRLLRSREQEEEKEEEDTEGHNSSVVYDM